MGNFLYFKLLKGNYSTDQPGQFLGMVYFSWSGAHRGHCMDVELQGFSFSSLLKCLLPYSTRWMSSHLQYLRGLLIHPWWQRGPLCNGGGICRWWHQQVIYLYFKKAEGGWVCIIIDVDNLLLGHFFHFYVQFRGCNWGSPLSGFTFREGGGGIGDPSAVVAIFLSNPNVVGHFTL